MEAQLGIKLSPHIKAFIKANYEISRKLASYPERECIILGCALIEDALVILFEEIMTQNKREDPKLFGEFGPLGTISAKSRLAYVLGHIDKSVREDIKYIARIRNCFAHQHKTANFGNEEVIKSINKLKLVKKEDGDRICRAAAQGMQIIPTEDSGTEYDIAITDIKRRIFFVARLSSALDGKEYPKENLLIKYVNSTKIVLAALSLAILHLLPEVPLDQTSDEAAASP